MAAGWRVLLLVALVAVAAGACAAPGASAVPAPHRSVEVALVDVFSGAGAESGRDLRNGLELQAGLVNASGGLLGSRVEVVTADGEANPAKAAELVRQEVGDAGVGLVVGPNTTAAFQAARPALDAAGVPSCLTRVTDEALATGRSTFRVGAANSAEVAVLLTAVRRARPDVGKIGLLDEGDELGRSYDSQLTAQSGGAGLGYVGHVTAGADGDQRAALQQLAALGAQLVVLSQQPGGAIRAAQADTQLGAGRPALAGFGALADASFVSVGGEAAVGAIVATTQQASLTSAPQAQWPSGYHAFVTTAGQLYGLGTDGARPQATPAGADCLFQWARAVRMAGTFQGAAVARAWETLDLPADETALGARERLTTGDHNAVAQDQLVAYTWTKEGSRALLQRVPMS
ncbi:MAG TPA: ABC transporter substrate-binding protein [Candidatus Dormibacteraeota bacterium]|nr:ABC transporter substrate-binding protein [Candidatus Dormibacteraeota bacterium]